MTRSLRSKRTNQAGATGEENKPVNVDKPSNVDVDSMLAELRHEFEQRITSFKESLEAGKSQQLQVFATSMVTIPKSLKRATIRHVNTLCQCDLIAMVKQIADEKGSSVAGKGPSVEVPKDTISGGMNLHTPAPARGRGRGDFTPMRTVRRGEALLYVLDDDDAARFCHACFRLTLLTFLFR